MSEQEQTEQKPPRTPPGPPDFVEGRQLPTAKELADWKHFQQQQQQAEPDEDEDEPEATTAQ